MINETGVGTNVSGRLARACCGVVRAGGTLRDHRVRRTRGSAAGCESFP